MTHAANSGRVKSQSSALRQKINFPNRFNLIWVVQSSRKKYFPWLQPQITGNFRASRPTGGAYRDRHGRWCGMRWTRRRS